MNILHTVIYYIVIHEYIMCIIMCCVSLLTALFRKWRMILTTS